MLANNHNHNHKPTSVHTILLRLFIPLMIFLVLFLLFTYVSLLFSSTSTSASSLIHLQQQLLEHQAEQAEQQRHDQQRDQQLSSVLLQLKQLMQLEQQHEDALLAASAAAAAAPAVVVNGSSNNISIEATRDAIKQQRLALIDVLVEMEEDSHIDLPILVDDTHVVILPNTTSHTGSSGYTSTTTGSETIEDNEHMVNYVICEQLRSSYHVQPLHNWGDMKDKSIQAQWDTLGCDRTLVHYDLQQRAHHRLHSLATRTYKPPIAYAVTVATQPVIAIAICTTTRLIWDLTDLTQLSLFHGLLPSLVETAEPGFEYWVYLTYDVGDLFYDLEAREIEIQAWFATHVAEPLLTGKEIVAHLYIIAFDNIERKPGPAFNHVLQAAYTHTAVNYFYRINDDTVFNTPFASALTQALLLMQWPYGVVGPDCPHGNTWILTHDFTHRTHMDIFTPYYYPPVLSDWFMDDAITRMYGRLRTRKVSSVKVSHAGSHGTRYSVDQSHRALVDEEVERGHKKIAAYIKAHSINYRHMTPAKIQEFEQDKLIFNVHSDH